MPEPIVIVGMPGSGVAETARLLQHCGIRLDDPGIADFNDRLRAVLSAQHTPSGDYQTDSLARQALQQEAAVLIRSLSPYQHWGWVESDNPDAIGFWQSVFPQLRLVVCLRHPLDQARAMSQAGKNTNFDEALSSWHAFYQALAAFQDRAVVIHYDALLLDARSELKRILSLLNITCDTILVEQTASSVYTDTLPSSVTEIYEQWRSRSSEGSTTHEQLRREIDARERNIDRMTEMIQAASEGRIGRLKRRTRRFASWLLPDTTKTKPYRAQAFPEIALVTVLTSQAKGFEATIRSVMAQTSPHWQWIIVCEAALAQLIQRSNGDPRIQLHPLETDKSPVEQWNTALEKAICPYILLLSAGDQLEKSALAAVGSILEKQPDIDCIYSDMIMQDGRQRMPFFKPDWSPVMMFSINLLEGLFVFRRDMLANVGMLNPQMAGGAYWDFCWRIAEQSSKIHHIPATLYRSARMLETKDRAEVQNARLQRIGLSPVSLNPPRWNTSLTGKVSIVIPSRDKAELLGVCLEKLFALTDYPEFEVIVVDTNSTEAATFALYERYRHEPRFRLVHYPKVDFNFSRACNLGAAHAGGSLLLFLNNDTEVLHADWLALMAQWFSDASVGIVGAKLLYPDGKIQHAGVILGLSGLVNHIFQGGADNTETIFGSDSWYRNFLAVTGACLMISRSVFAEVGGFDEAYQLNFSDVELCLRVYERGYQIIYTPDVRLLHREAQTHRYNIPYGDFEQASNDFRYWLIQGDPFFNPNLSYTSTQPQKSRHLFKSPYPNHLIGMTHIRALADR